LADLRFFVNRCIELQTLHLYVEEGIGYHELRSVLEFPELSRLRSLEADVRVERLADACTVLRGEPPFERLQVRSLHFASVADLSAEALDRFRADLAASESSPRLCYLQHLPQHHNVLLDGLADAALELRLARLGLRCALMATCAPAVARVLDGGTVTELAVNYGSCHPQPSERRPAFAYEAFSESEAESAAVLEAALKENTSLTSLALAWTGMTVPGWYGGNCINATGPLLIRALALHPRLRVLELRKNLVDWHLDPIHFFDTVADLVAANAPALKELTLSGFKLGEDVLHPLLNALARNTHLRVLHIPRIDVSLSFARNTLMPAVKACATLRRLDCSTEVQQQCSGLNNQMAVVRMKRSNRRLDRGLEGHSCLWCCCCCWCSWFCRGDRCCCCKCEHPVKKRLRDKQALYRTLRYAESLVASRGGQWL
jgi:hypothetical protein